MGPSDVAFWLSIVATLVAAFAAFVAYAVYRSQADPDVIVYVETDPLYGSVMNLVVENIGRSPAHDITFKTSSILPAEAWGISVSGTEAYEPMAVGPLIDGISFLPPGGKRTITWGKFGGLSKALGEGTVSVVAEFRARHFGIRWPVRLRSSSCIEVRSFEGTTGSERNFAKQIADNTKAINKTLDKIASTYRSGSKGA